MNNEKALTQLTAYAQGDIDPEGAIDVEALIEQYLENMLEPGIVVEIERAIGADARLAEIIDEARRGGAWIDEILVPEVRPRLERPVSPKMAKFVEDVIASKVKAEPEDGETSMVVPLRPKPAPQASTWRPWLMAASIAGLLATSGAAVYTVQTRLDATASRQLALEQEIEQLTTERLEQETRVADFDDRIGTLQVDLEAADQARADAGSTIAELQTEVAASTDQAQRLEQQRANLATELQQMQTARAESEATRTEVATALAASQDSATSIEAQLAQSEEAREVARQQLASAKTQNTGLQNGLARLEQQVATLALERQTVTARLENRNRQFAELEQEHAAAQTAAIDARDQIAQLAIDRRNVDAELAELNDRQRWLFQVAQYHTFYANLPQRRWAEESPGKEDDLQELLADLGQELGLDRPLPLPAGLSGLDFAGGRPLPVNGMPVVQLAYVDPDGKLFAFCFMRNLNGKVKARHPQRVGDLTMVDWSDVKFQYVVIGYGPLDALGKIASKLQGSYRLDT